MSLGGQISIGTKRPGALGVLHGFNRTRASMGAESRIRLFHSFNVLLPRDVETTNRQLPRVRIQEAIAFKTRFQGLCPGRLHFGLRKMLGQSIDLSQFDHD